VIRRATPDRRRRTTGRWGRWWAIAALAILPHGWALPGASAESSEPVVRAVLFFLPTCSHCHEVIDEVLPPLFAANGGEVEVFFDEALAPEDVAFSLVTNGRLEILFVNVEVQAGSLLFFSATEAFRIASQGVPRLIMGDQVMIGSVEIPQRLPEIISAATAAGDTIDWPAIPGIVEALTATGGFVTPTTTTTSETATTTDPTGGPGTATAPATSAAESAPWTTAASDSSDGVPTGPGVPTAGAVSMWDRFRGDVTGSSISLALLILILVALAGVALRWGRSSGVPRSGRLIPLLAVAGLGVAAYLAFVEVGGSQAVCGPVGDCNAVQQSEYSRLFGIVPVGVVGVIGYLVVIGAWVIGRSGRRPRADWAAVLLLAGAVAGTVLSAYLTFLEPFVIGATCMWCITSAAIVTLIMWLAVNPARAAVRRLRLVVLPDESRTGSRERR